MITNQNFIVSYGYLNNKGITTTKLDSNNKEITTTTYIPNKITINLVNYINTSTTADVFTYAYPFNSIPTISNNIKNLTTTNTQLTLPLNTLLNCQIVIND